MADAGRKSRMEAVVGGWEDKEGNRCAAADDEAGDEKGLRKAVPLPSSLSSSSSPALTKGRGGGANQLQAPCCQAERCGADLTDAKRYHRRHRVCEKHSKAPVVVVAGLGQRFCQQCSRFHELAEFDETKRSCRRRLAGHNERRRKSSSEPQSEGAGPALKENQCRQERVQLSLPGSSSYKHFHIR